MKTWQERWFEELDAATPALTDDVLNAPIESADLSTSTREKKTEQKNVFQKLFATKKSRIIGIVSACAAGLIGLGIALPSILNPYLPPSNPPVITASAKDAIVVEINPEAVFSVDSEGKVLSVVANNADADVILSSPARIEEMEGESIETAVEVFVDYAAQLGFLDYSTPDAIRISASKEECVEKLNDCLQTFFCEKGAMIVVIPETVTLETLCRRIGIDAQDTDKLVEKLSGLPELYSRRKAEGKDDKALEELYRETIPVEDVKSYFEETIRKNIEKIEKNIADVQVLKAKSQEIYSHADNPFAFLGGADFWTLKSIHKTQSERKNKGGLDLPFDTDWLSQYTEEFAALMTEMQTLLTAYEQEYGAKIDTVYAFEETVRVANSLPLQTLKALLEEFTVEGFGEHIDLLCGILRNIGIDVSFKKGLYDVPTTKEEYFAKTEQFIVERFDRLKDGNAAKYEENGKREKIDEQTYRQYVDGIVAEYGSLTEYWEVLKNS